MSLHRSIIRLAVEDAHTSYKWKCKVGNMTDIECTAMYERLVQNRTIKPADPSRYNLCDECNTYYRKGILHSCERS